MPGRGSGTAGRVTVVVGVDGSGRTHRLEALAGGDAGPAVRLSAPVPADVLVSRAAALPDGAVLVVDDVHLLDDGALDALAALARDGRAVRVSRRPTVDRPALAALDAVLGAAGDVEALGPLDVEAVADLLAAAAGRPCPPERAAAVHAASGGLPAVVVALAGQRADAATPPAALTARVQRALAVAGPDVARVAHVLAVAAPQLPSDGVLADAARPAVAEARGATGRTDRRTGSRTDVAAALRTLRDAGLLDAAGERMPPAVVAAVLADLPAAARRSLQDDLARALLAAGGAPQEVAQRLRAAQARGAAAADAFRAAGERLRFADPAAAVGWFDAAVEAGAAPESVAAGLAEAAALVGDPRAAATAGSATTTGSTTAAGSATTTAGPDAVRLAHVAAVLTARAGRPGAAADALLALPDPAPLVAVPLLVAAGRTEEARAAVDAAGPGAVRLVARAALAANDPASAVPAVLDAVDACDAAVPDVVLPDLPHATGAVVATLAGDAATAVDLLDGAVRRGTGGPAAADRHRLLLAWVRLRSGRPDLAAEVLSQAPAEPAAPRDRLLRTAVVVGLARRSGDVARIRAVWPDVERVLARAPVDLFVLEPVEELAVAAARMRREPRAAATLTGLADVVASEGIGAAWRVAAGWLDLQVAVAADDPARAAVAADRISAAAGAPTGTTPRTTAGPGLRAHAQQRAAARWAAALAGDVDADAVLDAAEALAEAELPWEAGRLAGDAALRVADATAARRLLERARDLAVPEPVALQPVTWAAAPGTGSGVAAAAARAGLSEREVEVARLVLDGRTHREIGAQLYIAPKTVEHHVARIRTKVGATTRAEFVAVLRGLLDVGATGPPG